MRPGSVSNSLTRTEARFGGQVGLANSCIGDWPERVAEGLVVPTKPGNAGGGKEPWFQGADEAAREGGD